MVSYLRTFFLHTSLLLFSASGIKLSSVAAAAVDRYDKVAIDLISIAFHLHNQSQKGEKMDPYVVVVREKKWWQVLLPYEVSFLPKPKEIVEGWVFYPFSGKTGAVDWGKGALTQESMIGFVACHREKKIIAVIFRGSQVVHDWLNNTNPGILRPSFLSFKGWVHAGYANAFMGSREGMEKALQECLRDLGEVPSGYELLVAGHSLGGALANLSIAYLAEHKVYKSYFSKKARRLITFGAPVVGMDDGTHAFGKWISERVVSKRFVRETDISPHATRMAKFSWPVGRRLPRFLYHIKPSPSGKSIGLPSYGAKIYQWYEAHHISLYRKAIYEALGLHEKYRPLMRVEKG